MSVRELAEVVGVTKRAVMYWQVGRSVPDDRSFGRLLKALRCDAQDLCGRLRGTETLADLRRDAGMSANDAAAALARKRFAQGLKVDGEKIRALELGRPVAGWGRISPETAGRLARMLAQVYGVPERVLMDAWRRSRPDDISPVLPERRTRSAGGRRTAWEALNDRQRTYLSCIFRQDLEEEKEQQRRRSMGGERSPAREWRRIPLAVHAPSDLVGYTRIQERLRDEGVHDPGVGSSVAALERRGIVTTYRDRVRIDGMGEVPRTRVELTRHGRAVARAGLEVPRDAGPPKPLLSRWLWRILVRVALAGDNGLDGSLAGRGPHALAVGRSPDGKNPSRGFIVLRHPDGIDSGPYFWFLTEDGRRHVADYVAIYRDLYPDVDTSGLDDTSGLFCRFC
jgi:transcriptional regulator with XRE-family HTH domain